MINKPEDKKKNVAEKPPKFICKGCAETFNKKSDIYGKTPGRILFVNIIFGIVVLILAARCAFGFVENDPVVFIIYLVHNSLIGKSLPYDAEFLAPLYAFVIVGFAWIIFYSRTKNVAKCPKCGSSDIKKYKCR